MLINDFSGDRMTLFSNYRRRPIGYEMQRNDCNFRSPLVHKMLTRRHTLHNANLLLLANIISAIYFVVLFRIYWQVNAKQPQWENPMSPVFYCGTHFGVNGL